MLSEQRPLAVKNRSPLITFGRSSLRKDTAYGSVYIRCEQAHGGGAQEWRTSVSMLPPVDLPGVRVPLRDDLVLKIGKNLVPLLGGGLRHLVIELAQVPEGQVRRARHLRQVFHVL